MIYPNKFCKDCVFFKKGGRMLHPWCENDAAIINHDVIYGYPVYMTPYVMRTERGPCKPEGLLFERKPPPEIATPTRPWWQRILGLY